MKNFLFLLMFMGMLISCDTEDNEAREIVILKEASISNTETYDYNLGYFGIEEGASILLEPDNAEVSEITPNQLGDQIYQYKAQENFVGSDYVEIRTGRGSNGSSPSTRVEIIKITIHVTE